MPGLCFFKISNSGGWYLGQLHSFLELRDTDYVVIGYAETHINSQLENKS